MNALPSFLCAAIGVICKYHSTNEVIPTYRVFTFRDTITFKSLNE